MALRLSEMDIPSQDASPPEEHNDARLSSSTLPYLNSSSCVTCRKRKVRCDKKKSGCQNCVKARIVCVYLAKERTPRKTRKPPDPELLKRLNKLEGVVQSLGAQVDGEGQVVPGSNYQHRTAVQEENPKSRQPVEIHKEVGRLVINEGKSRYVSNGFWASMHDEISGMRDALDPSSSEEEDSSSPDKLGASLASPEPNHPGFIFGYSSTANSLGNLHPSLAQKCILWEAFKENVDPLVRILHRPTLYKMICDTSTELLTISKPAEALFFATYYAAVVSLTPQQCQTLFGEAKAGMLNRYRFAVEQALARANFLGSSSLMTLQAFVLFLVCVRHQDYSRTVSSLSGLAVVLAKALGIHRDGSIFKLTPFEIEMRRRLWWHLSLLDTRSAEDHSTEPSFLEHSYDTRLPLNINDDDITPSSRALPEEHIGTTEMTFCLIRYELSVTTRGQNFNPPGDTPCHNERGTQSIEDKNILIKACHRRIEERYLQYCDMGVPIYWVCATVARLILAKMWLMANQPSRHGEKSEIPAELQPSEVRERFYLTSMEIIEFSHLLITNENTAKWAWLFRTYMQWHTVTYILTELCRRSPDAEYERGWRAVEMLWNIEDTPSIQKSALWRPLRLLYEKARFVRESHVREAQQAAMAVGCTGSQPCLAQETSSGQATNLDVVSSTSAALGQNPEGVLPQWDELSIPANELPLDGNGVSIPTANMNETAAELPTSHQNGETMDVLSPFFNSFANDPLAEFDFNKFPQKMTDTQTTPVQGQMARPDLSDEETINRWLSQGDIAYQQNWTLNFS